MNRTSSAFASQSNMKSVTARKSPPVTPAEWEALIAAAPGKDRPLTAAEKEKMANAVVVGGCGLAASRAAVAQKPQRGERGPQVAPTTQLAYCEVRARTSGVHRQVPTCRSGSGRR